MNKIIKVFFCLLILNLSPALAQDSADVYINGCDKFECISKKFYQIFAETFGTDQLKWLQIYELQFSPNGRYLSFYTSQAFPGAQLWIYDLVSRQISLSTSLGKKDGSEGFCVSQSKWISNDTILAKIFISHGSGGNDHFIKTSFQGKMKEIVLQSEYDEFVDRDHWDEVATAPSQHFRIVSLRDGSPISLIDLTKNGEVIFTMKHSYGNFKWTSDEKYFVFAEFYNSGSFRLKAAQMRAIFHPYTVEEGMFALGGLCVSPKGHLIAYPLYHSDVVVFDVEKKKILRNIGTGLFPSGLAWSSQNVLAIVCRKCENTSSLNNVQADDHNPPYLTEVYLYKLPSNLK